MSKAYETAKNRFRGSSNKLQKVRCRRCLRHKVIIRTQEINLCRHCFREVAKSMGFFKV